MLGRRGRIAWDLMADLRSGLRPDIHTFEYAGCQVCVVDVAGIRAAAARGRVELLREAAFPEPVRQVLIGVVHGSGGFVLDATIETGRPRARRGLAALGNDPVGVLLARRVAAGDGWATDVVDGFGTVAAGVSRRLGLGRSDRRPAPPVDGPVLASTARVDQQTGLRFTVTDRGVARDRQGRVVTVRATVPELSADHLRAMACVVLAEVGRVTGGGSGPDAERISGAGQAAGAKPAGRTYVLGRIPAAGASEDVSLDQVGGLDDVVAQFRRIAVSFRHPHAMARWGARRPQGVLLYGPPGTGKTMLARALSNEIGATFREIRTPEIIDKWLGASERNLKRIFREARRHREPTVLFFDEFDSIISYVGSGQDAAGQAVNAVAGLFKQEMNALIEENPNVIVVATTNFVDRVDDSLIRSGRFDVKLEIPPPDEAGRGDILTRMIRELIATHERPGFRMFAADVDPAALAREGRGLTGADLKEVLRRVRLAKALDEAHGATSVTPISQTDLLLAIRDLRTG
jgi:transitional endoplasmic reticulum ATPase